MATKFAYDRIFGSDIKQSIQDKLKSRQNANVGVNFGDTVADSETNKTNFEGELQFSSKMPWSRIWTVIQNYSISPDIETSQKKALEDSTNFKSDVVVNDIKIYQINSNEFQDRTTQNTPVAGKMRDFLSQNDYSTPEAGITSIRSESSGFAGLVKTTTIEFKVFNYFDFDNIILPFFLTPGATIYCDFGWSTSDMYNPDDFLKGEQRNASFEHKSFNEKIFGEKGVLGNSNGDLEVITGIVSKYDVRIDELGNFDCTITLTSKNYALIDYGKKNDSDDDNEIPIDIEMENAVYDRIIKRMKEENPGIDIKKTPNKNYGELTKKYLATYVGTYSTRQFFEHTHEDSHPSATKAQLGTKNLINDAFPAIPTRAYNTGIYFQILDRTARLNSAKQTSSIENTALKDSLYITFGLFAELLNDILAQRSEEFTDGDIEFVFDDIPLTFNKHLFVKQMYLSAFDKRQLAFLYPTRKRQYYDIESYKIDGSALKSAAETTDLSLLSDSELDDLADINLGDLFINFDRVLAIFRTEKSVELALKKVLDMLNLESHGVFKLRLVSDGTISKNVSVVDTNWNMDTVKKSDDSENIDDVFEFKVFSPNTVVNSVDLNMTMGGSSIANRLAIQGMTAERMLFPSSEQMKVDIALADTTRDVGENQFFTHLPVKSKKNSDDYIMKQVGVFKDSTIKKVPNTEQQKAEAAEIDQANKQMALSSFSDFKALKKKDKKAEKPFDAEYQKYKKDVVDLVDFDQPKYFPRNIFVEDLGSYFKFKVKDSEVQTQSFANVLLPYTLTFTIYGISGIIPGNRLRIDYLPERYRTRTYFVVKQVSHELSPTGWKTTISADMKLWGDKLYKNIVKYRPQVHLSKRKLNKLGYGSIQWEKIYDHKNGYKNPTEFYYVTPTAYFKGCRDGRANGEGTGKATNYVKWYRYDCAGTYEGKDFSCCKYPPPPDE